MPELTGYLENSNPAPISDWTLQLSKGVSLNEVLQPVSNRAGILGTVLTLGSQIPGVVLPVGPALLLEDGDSYLPPGHWAWPSGETA